MELLQLQYFSEVVRQKSVTKAAQLLHISQPALSQTIRRLENELGVKLFEKSGKGIQLTAKGRRFYSQISPALGSIRSAAEDITSDRLQGCITLGSYLPLSPLLPCIQEFSALNPDVTFNLLSLTDTFSPQADQLDGILGYAHSNSLGLSERRLVAVYSCQYAVPAQHTPPADGCHYTLNELKNDSFVSLYLPGDQEEEIFSEFARAGISPNIRYHTNNLMFKQQIIEAGLATGFSNVLLTQIFRPTGHYKLLHYPHDSKKVFVVLNWRSSDVLSAAAQKFKDFCCERFPEYRL